MSIPKATLASLLQQFGLPGNTGLTLMRVGTNAIYRVDEFDAVLRVHCGSAREVAQNLSLVKKLSKDAPLLPPLQPKVAVAGDFCATLWPLCTAANPATDSEAFGSALRRFHRAKVPDGMRRVNLLDPVPERIRRCERLGVVQFALDYFNEEYEKLLPVMLEIASDGDNPLHCDAHIGNAVVKDEHLYLIDLDDLSTGPWQLDFVPAWTAARRMGTATAYIATIGPLRETFEQWHYLQASQKIRELTMLSWLGTLWGNDERINEEFTLRMETVTGGKTRRYWKPV